MYARTIQRNMDTKYSKSFEMSSLSWNFEKLYSNSQMIHVVFFHIPRKILIKTLIIVDSTNVSLSCQNWQTLWRHLFIGCWTKKINQTNNKHDAFVSVWWNYYILYVVCQYMCPRRKYGNLSISQPPHIIIWSLWQQRIIPDKKQQWRNFEIVTRFQTKECWRQIIS